MAKQEGGGAAVLRRQREASDAHTHGFYFQTHQLTTYGDDGDKYADGGLKVLFTLLFVFFFPKIANLCWRET